LRPGIPGLSETITVTSIVGRFLEHTRIYYFRNGGEEEVWLGSADLMPRNLDRRVEILFPIDDPRLRQTIVQDILRVHLQDNVQARRLRPDGSYERLSPPPNTEGINAQAWMLQHWKTCSESLASHTHTRTSQGEQGPSGFLSVPETGLTAPHASPVPSSNGGST
jgi:polyphosphate kinase